MAGYDYNAQAYRSPQRVWSVEKQAHLDKWETVEDFTLTLPDGLQIFIPAGFEYDKASVPRLAQWYLRRDDRKAVIAALVHDFLYEYRMLTRKRADQIFYDLLRDAGMRWTKARMAWLAVRAGGWRAWND